MLTFPLSLTYDQIAAMPNAAEDMGWDDSMIDEDTPNLASHIQAYLDACANFNLEGLNPRYHAFPIYLARIGFVVHDERLDIRDSNALRIAHALMCQIFDEYDRVDEPHATWDLFSISGDDSVDYYGTQPSSVTSILIRAMEA